MYKEEFRFSLTTDSGTFTVTPRYSDSLKLSLDPEAEQVFKRTKLNGKFSFMRSDFDLIDATAFDFEFIFHIDRKDSLGVWSNDFWVGIFTKTDCEFDEDINLIEVQPEPNDEYKTIMEGMNKEFNLVEAAPVTTELNVKVQALVQIYIAGTDTLTSILSGTHYEQETTVLEDDNLVLENTYFFGTGINKIFIAGASGANLDPDVSGFYIISNPTFPKLLREGDSKYQILPQDNGSGSQWTITDETAGSAVVYVAPVGESLNFIDTPALNYFRPFLQGALFTSETSASTCRLFSYYYAARLLTNETVLDGNPTFELPAEDIVATNSAYTRALPLDDYTGVTTFDGNSATPFRYGKFIDNAANFADLYFTKPVFDPVDGIDILFPVSRSEWTELSVWFYYTPALRTLQSTGSEDRIYKQVYKVGESIKTLLALIDPSVSHELTSDYSDFFYSNGNNIKDKDIIPMISPKSNFVIGEYDQAATKAIIRLADIFSLLRDFYQVYWYIEDSKLKLEHIDFFDRGKTYFGTNVAFDLTLLVEPKTKKQWDYKTAKYKFDKSKMPEQIKHSWMDEVSEPFEGFPINMVSNYVQKGDFKDLSMSLFTSDIDFVFGQSESISKEGFMFFEASDISGTFSLAFVDIQLDYPNEYRMQNGYASIIYAHKTFWKYNLPCSSVNLNNEDITATSVEKRRLQEIEFSTNEDIDTLQLIKTSLGEGRIQKLDISLTSKDVKMTIRHETE